MTAEELLDRVRRALRHLLHGLTPFVETRMAGRYGVQWRAQVSYAAGVVPRGALDEYALLKTLLDRWREVFEEEFARADRYRARNFVSTAFEARNAVAHAAFDIEDAAALRYLDACHELLRIARAPNADLAAVRQLYEAQRRSGIAAMEPGRSAPLPVTFESRAAVGGSRSRFGATVDERLLHYVREHPDLDDDELSRNLGIRPRQSINQSARRLAERGLLRRFVGPRGKIVNRAEEGRR